MTPITRRTALASLAAAAVPVRSQNRTSSTGKRLRKIATEEAFNIPEVADALTVLVGRGGTSLDLQLLAQIYGASNASLPPADPAPAWSSNRDLAAQRVLPRLLDLGELRLADMDANGVDMHLLSLTMPGVQMFDRDTAVSLSRVANDRLRDAVRRHPQRFAGLASFAPQAPEAAAKEMERAIRTLHLNGFIVNSHTDNAYLDEQRFWPILEAAEALGAPLYIHPRAPSDGMARPFADYRIEGAVWGYGVETSTHVVRLMMSGALDRFPRLRIVIGHMGEALPFWLWRLDFMGAPGARAVRKNQLKPSDYFRRNIAITTSGVEDPAALRFCIDKIGVDNIMWAIDYPYQPTAPAVAFIEGASLSDDERERIAFRNAERIFGIGPAA